MKKIYLLLAVLLVPFILQAEIYTLNIAGPIEAITEEYVDNCFATLREAPDAKLLIITMDTPGGIDTSMRAIIKEILDSPVPVAVYVHPKGARAASAGFFIMVSADIAAMAPGTNTGAAHPVSVTGGKMDETMKEKVTNDAVSYIKSLAKNRGRNMELSEKAVKDSQSYTAEECLEKNLSEYIAKNVNDLIDQLEGKEITMANGKKVTLRLKGQNIITLEMSKRQQFLKTITNPNIAYFLLIFGLIGLYLEFTHPGMIIPGVIGGICLLLAFMAFQILPVNYIGLLLIVLAIGFFIAEIKIQGFGAFGIGGIISFVLGSIMLINAPIPEMRPTMSIIIMVAVTFGILFMFLTFKVIQAMKRKTETGQEGMCGEKGIAKSDITINDGKVFVHGEWWNAASAYEERIPKGSAITVVSVDNFVLKVKKGG
ncbi:MAG: nodulation protein NfeD [bacterium]|nr:nodulation protein NfeD [bacterium]